MNKQNKLEAFAAKELINLTDKLMAAAALLHLENTTLFPQITSSELKLKIKIPSLLVAKKVLSVGALLISTTKTI
jgi:hypothetical protein